jgi:sarcosine oxidase delta subunit
VIKWLECPICGKRLKTQFALQGHIFFAHKTEKEMEMKEAVKMAEEAYKRAKAEDERRE